MAYIFHIPTQRVVHVMAANARKITNWMKANGMTLETHDYYIY